MYRLLCTDLVGSDGVDKCRYRLSGVLDRMFDIVDRFPLYPLIFSFVLYPIAAWMVLRLFPKRIRIHCFTILNVAGLGVLCWLAGANGVRLRAALSYSRAPLLFFSIFVGLVLLNYPVLKRCRRDDSIWPAAAFLLPVIFLVYIKYASDSVNPFAAVLAPIGLSRFAIFFIGISYLSFRLVHLVQEVRNEIVEMPTVWEYLSFAFFVPTLSVGPISSYSKFIGSMRAPDRQNTPVGRSLLRIVVGLTKYIFLGSLVAQVTYAGLLRDGHPHSMIDLFIAIPAYAVYLYCNFSGFCDMVIGVSGLLGIAVAENFDRPFMARNLQEFWNRWHITLSLWIRDLLFTPLSKSLVRKFGPKSANHVIAVSILISFLVVGAWHGKGSNFLVFGALQGAGLVTVHYYTVWLKRRFGRDGYTAYRKGRFIQAIATVTTFSYFSLTLFFLANTWEEMRVIRDALR
jgi:D-alanyl-lipoteichoic acid acyltransferase DltB (MBOAT superfamily)